MIREFLIGSVVLGGGGYYVASSYTSADVVRTVKATPHDTWRALSVILPEPPDDMGEGVEFGNSGVKLKPVVSSIDGKEIDFRLVSGQKEMARVHVRLEPLAGGAQTKLMIDANISAEAMPENFPGPAGNIIFRRVLGDMTDKAVAEIESGRLLVQGGDAFAEMRSEMRAHPGYGEAKMRVQEYERREAIEAAARPDLDPNAGRLDPKGAAVVPMNPNPDN